MIIVILVFSLAALSIILGFIALLTQKIYIDSETKQTATEIEIPFLGKLRTNIPALGFVFLGIFLAAFAFNKASPVKKVEWNLKGQFRNVGDQQIDWTEGTLSLIPKTIKPEVSNQGIFYIDVDIDEGKTIEDAFECIMYSNTIGSVEIFLKNEYEAYEDNKKTLIETVSDRFRKYKPVSIEPYDKEDNQ